MNLEDLAAKIQVLEDVEAIKKLKATYCYLCDAGLDDVRNRDDLISHFTNNARLDFGMGPARMFQHKEVYAHGTQSHHRGEWR
jgi:hypothetical protein